MEEIMNLLKETMTGISFFSAGNGELGISCDNPEDIPGVVSTIAEAMQAYNIMDIQIQTNSTQGKVYFMELDSEEFEE